MPTPSNLWLSPGSQFHEARSLCQSRQAAKTATMPIATPRPLTMRPFIAMITTKVSVIEVRRRVYAGSSAGRPHRVEPYPLQILHGRPSKGLACGDQPPSRRPCRRMNLAPVRVGHADGAARGLTTCRCCVSNMMAATGISVPPRRGHWPRRAPLNSRLGLNRFWAHADSMIAISITPEAYRAIKATLPDGADALPDRKSVV